MKCINVEINGNFSSLSFDFKHEFDSGITTLLGHIGSGKSTIVDSISGFGISFNYLFFTILDTTLTKLN